MKFVLASILVGVCAVAMARIVAIDLEQRRIPRQLCWAIAASGSLLQLMVLGSESLAVGLLVGMAVVVACRIAARFLGEHCIGRGDVRCMTALSLATGWGAPVGFIACFSCAAVWSLVRKWHDREHGCDPFAFAPFLAVCLAAGGLACAL